MTKSAIDNYAAESIRFSKIANDALCAERRRAEAKQIAQSSVEIFAGRLKNYIVPFFSEIDPQEINLRNINEFVSDLQSKNLKGSSIRLILTSLRRVLFHAYLMGVVESIPLMPRIRSDSTPRGGVYPPGISPSLAGSPTAVCSFRAIRPRMVRLAWQAAVFFQKLPGA